MLMTRDLLKPFEDHATYCPPELYDKPVPEEDVKTLKIAIRLYIRQLKKYEERAQDMYEDMRMWGAPIEDFREDGYFDTDRDAYKDIVNLFPELASKYFVGFSPLYGKEASHGMGRYDRYGGL